jgi:hypothetical protein
MGLQGQEGMVQYLADYGHEEPQELSSADDRTPSQFDTEAMRTTYNILLEFGELDLEEYFWERRPPELPSEVEKFWQSLFEVANTVEGIHNRRTTTNGVNHTFNG